MKTINESATMTSKLPRIMVFRPTWEEFKVNALNFVSNKNKFTNLSLFDYRILQLILNTWNRKAPTKQVL